VSALGGRTADRDAQQSVTKFGKLLFEHHCIVGSDES
jgi:hypothetical protein